MRTSSLRLLFQLFRLPLSTFHVLATTASTAFRSRATFELENLAFRHQLGVPRRSVKRPKLPSADRLLWAWLCEVWNDWRSALVIVKRKPSLADTTGDCLVPRFSLREKLDSGYVLWKHHPRCTYE